VDKLFLRQLAVPVLIGVYEHERITPQVVLFDLETEINVSKAAKHDDIAATVDYAAVYHYLRDYLAATRFQLLETLAENVSQNLMKKFSLTWLRLTLTKKPADLPDLTGAIITIERRNQPNT